MTKFRVGDRVRYKPCIETGEWQNIILTKYDKGRINPWVGTDPIRGEGAFKEDWIELIPSDDELTTLRKFRERALSTYPDLAEPETDEKRLLQEAADIIQNWRNGKAGEDDALDTARLVKVVIERALLRSSDLEEPETDEEAVRRIMNEHSGGNNHIQRMCFAAIAWARANPQNQDT